MKSTPIHDHGVMEEKGSYNRYSRIPAGGMSLALPRLQEAVQKVELDRDEQPVVVADYGSSQGKNSLASCPSQLELSESVWGPIDQFLCSTSISPTTISTRYLKS